MYLLSAVLIFLAALLQAITGFDTVFRHDYAGSVLSFFLVAVFAVLGIFLVKCWKVEKRVPDADNKK